MDTNYQILDLSIKALGLAATAGGVIYAANTYARNGRLEKAKWLSQLHDKFFYEHRYAAIRKLIDYEDPKEDYNNLKDCFSKKDDFSNAELQESLIAYLNFFEFIATLEKENQLSRDEINMMFGYYLSDLNKAKNKWIKDSLKDCEFKNLPGLIDKIAA